MTNGIIFNNKIIDVVFIAMMIAQLTKVFSPLLKGKKPNITRIFETGGMPSSHASTVCSLTTSIALVYHLNSIEFAIAFVFSIIVMYDAAGIRREAGKHAKLLNKILLENKFDLFDTKEFKEFKEFLGHSPKEVFFGAILGILVSFLMKGYLI
ncbi:divergent PAP2 family protein [Oceanivirga miroungae]|uniref:Acid phosphatase/vanadium-dependent haloperoxidase-like protein n=1 Tax=Oceanivirga miroungae TaxID=1130046 RepID=A0A6I8M998_9FUSO|nr:divergent PAP2 family protein [Oceanivirga miroungae]VWL85385.1 acid phosphatase/vanadium-dependent haloperoxidase-like protein [Oceanivirga miroungae]